jgi:hypothetical protein
VKSVIVAVIVLLSTALSAAPPKHWMFDFALQPSVAEFEMRFADGSVAMSGSSREVGHYEGDEFVIEGSTTYNGAPEANHSFKLRFRGQDGRFEARYENDRGEVLKYELRDEGEFCIGRGFRADGTLIVRSKDRLQDGVVVSEVELLHPTGEVVAKGIIRKKRANQSSQRNAMAWPLSVFESHSSRG